MQRFVRLSLAALVSLVALNACGDKVTVTSYTPPTVTPTVTGVTVAPPAAVLNIGQTINLFATVTADASITERGVNWTSSDATIATVSSTGLVTALKAGSVAIQAASKAAGFTGIVGGASITVNAAAATVPATVAIAAINSNATGLPMNLTNAGGQMDVVVAYDPGTQSVTKIELLLKRTTSATDTVVDTRTVGNGSVAGGGVSEALTYITMNFNSAAFTTTNGATAFKNGQISLSARLTIGTAASSQLGATTAGAPMTLNNADFVRAIYTATTPSAGQIASATDAAGLLWQAGGANVQVLGVFYTAGRSIGTPLTVNLVNNGNAAGACVAQTGNGGVAVGCGGTVATQTVALGTTPIPTTFSFPNSAVIAANNIGGATIGAMVLTVLAVDNLGAPAPVTTVGSQLAANTPCGGFVVPPLCSLNTVIRLDNQGPAAGAYTFGVGGVNQFSNNNWINAAYLFSSTAGQGYTANVAADNGGVGRVVVSYESALASAPTVWTAITNGGQLANSPVTTPTTYRLRMTEKDALGNATLQVPNLGLPTEFFGVDKQVPQLTFAAAGTALTGTTAQNTATLSATAAFVNTPNWNFTFVDSISGFSGTPASVVLTRNFSGAGANCVVGVAPTCTATPNLPASQLADGGAAVAGYYTITEFVRDEAGNASNTLTGTVLLDPDATPPAFSGGIALPGTILGGATQVFTATVSDNVDVAFGRASLRYTMPVSGTPANFQAGTTTLGTPSTTFDGTFVTTSTVNATFTGFWRSLGEVNATDNPAGNNAKPFQIDFYGWDARTDPFMTTVNVASTNANLPPINIENSLAVGPACGVPPCAVFAPSAANTWIMGPGAPGGAGAAQTNGTNTNTSLTLTAVYTGPIATTPTPFANVCWYYGVPPTGGAALLAVLRGGLTAGARGAALGPVAPGTASAGSTEYVQISCQSAPSITDNLITGIRTITYTAPATFNAPGTGAITMTNPGPAAPGLGIAGNFVIRAFGITAGFDVLATRTITYTLAN